MKSAKIVIVATLVLMVALVACTEQKPIETAKIEFNHYPACGEVVEVNRENGKVVVEDFNGNLWAFEGTEDWMEGDICAMIMSDEATPEIYDDVIIQVRYCGYNY